MVKVPAEICDRAIAEMEASFGFSEGVKENFHQTMQIAIEIHQSFLEKLPDPNFPPPVPLASFRHILPERRAAMARTFAAAGTNVAQVGQANRQFLEDSHRLRLGTFFRIGGRISPQTADTLVDWVVNNIR